MKIELGKFGNKLKGAYMIGSKPIQDWQRVVTICFAVLLGVFIWSYFFYSSVQSEFKNDFGDSSQVMPVKNKEVEIKEVIDKYKTKEGLWLGVGQQQGLGSTTISSSTSAVK